MNVQSAFILERTAASKLAVTMANGSEPALNVVTVYQDSLTRHWAAELWDRVGQFIDRGSICLKFWNLSELREVPVFPQAVQVAARADVLVISVRDAEELPYFLRVWIEAWMPRRAGHKGALVALIGVSPQPDTRSGRVYHCLEDVARRAGLDFLPQERRLTEQPVGRSALPGVTNGQPHAGLTLMGA